MMGIEYQCAISVVVADAAAALLSMVRTFNQSQMNEDSNSNSKSFYSHRIE